MRRITVFRAGLVLSGALPLAAAAVETRSIGDVEGHPAFELRYFDTGDGPFNGSDASTWDLSTRFKDKSTEALRLWLQILRPKAPYLPGVINIGTTDDDNAYSSSPLIAIDGTLRTQLEAVLLGMDPGPMAHAHSVVTIGRMNFDSEPYQASQLALTPLADFNSTLFHEFAHSLGLLSVVSNTAPEAAPNDPQPHIPKIPGLMNRYLQMLHDDNGNPSRPDQYILCTGCDTPETADAFDVRRDQGYLSGPHIQEVLAGGLRGIPVKMLGDDGRVDDNYMGHSELKNSMMSHQTYNNYTTFMEAELALMQDIGYSLDRRNFFGRSIYGSGLDIVNEQGYFQRDATGSRYLPGQYNTATLGMGLHIYGSHNVVRQQADLLTQGVAGAGVRVDGEGNTLIVAPQTRIHALGQNGRGIMFAYGRNHELVQRGEVRASGPDGIGVDFDFGNNAMGNKEGYRGSYIQLKNGVPVATMLDELRGPLVSRYDLSGTLQGSRAALRLSPNALVERINILRGASISGPILSEYRERDEAGALRLTTLSFGLAADDQGRATQAPDAAFDFRHGDGIQGENLDLRMEGGRTALDGSLRIHGLRVAPGATLGGNGNYTLGAQGALVNHGTVAPGHSLGRIEIAGDFEQGAGGRLLMEVDGQGRHDVLAVSGQARLAGQLTVVPEAGWYASSWSLPVASLLQAGSYQGQFHAVAAQWSSPTLSLLVGGEGGAQRLSITRQADAYSRWAADGNARSVGRALTGVALQARPDMQLLLGQLDFSAPDGSQITHALQQLGTDAHGALFANAVQRERYIADLLPAPPLARLPGGGEWHAYASGFMRQARRDTGASAAGLDSRHEGLLAGAERRLSGDWAIGFFGVASQDRVSVKAPYDATGKSTALHLGLSARYEPDPRAGPHLALQGRVGVEWGRMDRRLALAGGYQAAHRARWTGHAGGLKADAGYRWALSPSLSLGPVAGLDYARLRRPAVEESGAAPTRLSLDAVHADSLRASLGAELRLSLGEDAARPLSASLRLAWERELLDTSVRQGAHFAGYPAATFQGRHTLAARDALATRVSLSYTSGDRLAVEGHLAGHFAGAGQRSLAAGLGVRWKF